MVKPSRAEFLGKAGTAGLALTAGAVLAPPADAAGRQRSARHRTSGPHASVTRNTSVRTVLTDDRVKLQDEIVLAKPAGGPLELQLPDATVAVGRQFVVRNIQENMHPVTITTVHRQSIDRERSLRLASHHPYVSVALVSDGANWWTI